MPARLYRYTFRSFESRSSSKLSHACFTLFDSYVKFSSISSSDPTILIMRFNMKKLSSAETLLYPQSEALESSLEAPSPGAQQDVCPYRRFFFLVHMLFSLGVLARLTFPQHPAMHFDLLRLPSLTPRFRQDHPERSAIRSHTGESPH